MQVLQIGVEVELASKILTETRQTRIDSPPPGTVFAAPPRNHAAGEHITSGAPVREGNPPSPRRFGQPRECPNAHDALDLEHDEEDHEGLGDLIALVEAIFLVFAPRYRHEVYQLMIPSDCTVNEAIQQIADTRDSATSICFACLTPALPQPTSAFACLLATPVWISSGVCLLDARSINQGIFAHQFFGRIKRASILLQIGYSPPSDLQVFYDGNALEDEVLYEFPTGSLLVILPAEAGYVARPTFHQVLTNSGGWDPSDPFLHPEVRTDFLMIHEHGQRVLPIDLDNDDTSAKFKCKAAEEFLFDVAKVTACPSVPRVQDYTHLGRPCLAIVAVTEGISRIPIPPGRPLLMKHIVFIDRRPILKDVVWMLATLGILDVDRLLRDLQDTVPFGHSLSLTGGRRETREDRNYVKVAHGEVLVLKYVEDLPSAGPAASEDDDESSEESDSGASDSGGSSSNGDSVLRSPDSSDNHDGDKPDRSRSPRNGPPPPKAMTPCESPRTRVALSCRRRRRPCHDGAGSPVCDTINATINLKLVEPIVAHSVNSAYEILCKAHWITYTDSVRQCKLLSEPVGQNPRRGSTPAGPTCCHTRTRGQLACSAYRFPA